MELNIIIPDCHVPHEDRRAFNLLFKVLDHLQAKHKIKRIYLLGDFADVYFANQHGNKHPQLPSTIQAEVKAVNARLDQIDARYPRAEKIYIEGNHEFRLERFILNKCPELFGVTTIDKLFRIDKRPKWTWVEYKSTQLVSIGGSHLFARHEPIGSTAKQTSNNAKCSLVWGHTHRMEESHTVGIDGTSHVAFSCGWLGDKRQDIVFDYCRPQWQLGFATVYTDPKTKAFFHHKHLMLEHGETLMTLVDGKVFSA